MAIVTTKAIVLSAIKYNDSSLIVKCFTAQEGVKTYLIRGVLKAKKGGVKIAYFQPLTLLKIEANHNNKGSLSSLKDVQIFYQYKTIYKDIVKQSVVLFLSEVLSKAIQEEEKNTVLYEYLETALVWLDSHEKSSNFHLLFLVNLTKILGFYPDISQNEKLGFDLVEGNFSNALNEKNVISGNTFHQFKKLLAINFDEIENISFSKKERQLVLQTIIRYFELHLDGFKRLKSLEVLETVFT